MYLQILSFQYPEEDINVDAYVIVFSITDKWTYEYAVRMIKYLRNDLCTDRSILVVGNKTDLVRKRTVDRNGMYAYWLSENGEHRELKSTQCEQVLSMFSHFYIKRVLIKFLQNILFLFRLSL